MYKKKIKRGKKIYTYYYHNYREKGKIKNVFLGSNKEEAVKKLKRINNILSSAPAPKRDGLNIYNYLKDRQINWFLFLIVVVLLSFGVYYFSVTGLVSYNAGDVRIFANSAPSVPANLNPSNNSWQIYNNYTIQFDWDNSTDSDGDLVTYEFQLANSSAFNITYLVTNVSVPTSEYTLNSSNLSLFGKYYWRVRAFDNTDFSAYSNNIILDVVYAVINITQPTYDQQLTANNPYTVRVYELDNGGFVDFVTFQARGDGAENKTNMTASVYNSPGDLSNYTLTYTVPNVQEISYVTLVATGYNGSNLSLTVNDTQRVIVYPNRTILIPVIDSVCGLPTYVSLDNITNITVRANLDTTIESINVTLTEPDSISRELWNLQNNSLDYINTAYGYNYNYSFLANKTGTYIVYATVFDSANKNATRNISIYSDNPVNFNLTGINLTSMELRDICDNRLITSGSSIAGGYPRGQYNLVSKVSKPYINLINATLNESLRSVCYFDDSLELIANPVEARAIDQFQFNCTESGIMFTKINLSYNYNTITTSIRSESNLQLYKCFTKDVCTWIALNATVLADNDLVDSEMREHFTNYSMFMIGEKPWVITTTVTAAVSGGALVGSKSYIDLIHPGKLTLYANDSITTPIIVWNKGTIDLSGIVISTESNNPALILSLDKSRIESLTVNNQETVRLTIKPLTEIVKGGNYEVTVYADVTSPVIRDSVKIYIDLMGEEMKDKRDLYSQLQFARDLFEGNPECLELSELLDQAEAAYNNGEYSKAQSLIDAAIDSCKAIVEAEGKQLEIPKLGLSDTYIIAVELIIFLIIFGLVYNYYRKKKFKGAKS